MAVIKDYIADNGARVIIRDDCYAGLSEEVLERRRQITRAKMMEIDWKWAERQYAAKIKGETT